MYAKNDLHLFSYKDVKKHKNFDTLEEAVLQREEWENEYFGEFKYQIREIINNESYCTK